jgi:hypothetical protein
VWRGKEENRGVLPQEEGEDHVIKSHSKTKTRHKFAYPSCHLIDACEINKESGHIEQQEMMKYVTTFNVTTV